MATAKKAPATVKKAPKAAAKSAAPMKRIKTAFNRTSLNAHVAAKSGVEPKAVKAVLATLEATILASVNKSGLGEFTMPAC